MKIERKNHKLLLSALLLILSATMVLCVFLLLTPNSKEPAHEDIPKVEPREEEPVVNPEPVVKQPAKVDFQSVVDEWVDSVAGDKGIVIYDLDRDEVTASYNPDDKFATASIYKLFVVYEGYRLLEDKEWQADDPAGSTGYTIAKCLDLAIRESNSSCAETLWAKIGHDNLEDIVKNDFGLANTYVEDLLSTPMDVMSMMKRFYYHNDINDPMLVEQMKDSFLNQPKTEYDWRQGLPSGFEIANVYNKVGWEYVPDGGYWWIYDDAAIVEFPEQDRNFIVVVMTNKIDYKQIRKLGQDIEKTFLDTI